MQWKRRVPCRVFFFLFLALVGCSRPRPVERPPYAGSVVRVRCPSDVIAHLVEAYSRGWQSRQKAKVQVIVGGIGEEADVWVMPAAEMPRWAAEGKLEPVPEDLTEPNSKYNWMGLLPLYSQRLLLWDRSAVSLPLRGSATLCCYRSDLLADAHHQSAYQKKYGQPLAAPVTWKDLEQIAAYFAEAAPTGVKGSLPPLTPDEELEHTFYAAATAYAVRAIGEDEATAGQREDIFSFYYDLKTGRPRIDQPGCVHALQLLQRLQKYRLPGKESAAEAFRKGSAVLCLTDASAVRSFQDSKVRDHFSICRVPAGEVYFGPNGPAPVGPNGNAVPYLGAGVYLAVVPRQAAQRDAAFSLLADLSGRDTSAQILLDTRSGHGGGVIRIEQLEERMRWDAFNLDDKRTRQLKEVLRQTLLHPGLKNPVLCLRTPDQHEKSKILVEELRPALEPGADAAEALSRVAKRWADLDRKRGAETALAEYRISLGLLAR